MKRLLLTGIVAATTMLAACSGEDGVDGAQGPPGTANVISGRDTVANADWSSTTTQIPYSTSNSSASFGKPARFLDLNVPQLTAQVHAGGAVLVWMQSAPVLGDANTFVPLPWNFVFLSSPNTYHYVLDLTPGRIRVLFFVQNLTDPGIFGDPLAPTQATRIFRWVLIPPAAAAAVQALRLDDGPDVAIAELARRGFKVN
jgi:hypothetical protein